MRPARELLSPELISELLSVTSGVVTVRRSAALDKLSVESSGVQPKSSWVVDTYEKYIDVNVILLYLDIEIPWVRKHDIKATVKAIGKTRYHEQSFIFTVMLSQSIARNNVFGWQYMKYYEHICFGFHNVDRKYYHRHIITNNMPTTETKYSIQGFEIPGRLLQEGGIPLSQINKCKITQAS